MRDEPVKPEKEPQESRPTETMDQVSRRIAKEGVERVNARAKTDPNFQVPY
jgi:hypothetical protein